MFKGLAAFCQLILDGFAVVLNVVCSIFPKSPFVFVRDGAFADLIAKINYFIPIYEMVAIAEAWLIAVAIWYGISVVARWVKAIE